MCKTNGTSAAAIAAVAFACGTLHAGIIAGEYSGRHAIGIGPDREHLTTTLDQTFDHPETVSLFHQYDYYWDRDPYDGGPILTHFAGAVTNTQSRTTDANHISLVQRGDFIFYNMNNPRTEFTSAFTDLNAVTQTLWADYGDLGFLFYEQHSAHAGHYEVIGVVRNEDSHEIMGAGDFSDGPASLAFHVAPGVYSVTIFRDTWEYLGLSPQYQYPYPAYAHSRVDIEWVPTPGCIGLASVAMLTMFRRHR
jgi:hypothetical protein